MNTTLYKHFTSVSAYTYPGAYRDYFLSLPDDVPTLGNLVCGQIIHPITLLQCDPVMFPLFGDLTRYPKYRLRNEDDIFPTAVAMTAELFRLDPRGFVADRRVEDKLVLTCRYVSVLMCAILKAKSIPCRSRAGFFQYWPKTPNAVDTCDHWINEYWSDAEQRWIAFDADGFYPFEEKLGFSQYDVPRSRFAWASDTWLGIRAGRLPGSYYKYSDNNGTLGLKAAVRQLFYDFHSLMNDEVSYNCMPSFVYNNECFSRLNERDLSELDVLAELMLDPDANLEELKRVFDVTDKYRLMCSPLAEGL